MYNSLGLFSPRGPFADFFPSLKTIMTQLSKICDIISIIGLSQLSIIPNESWGLAPATCVFACSLFLLLLLSFLQILSLECGDMSFRPCFYYSKGSSVFNSSIKIIIIINQNLCKTRNFYKIKADIEAYFSQKYKPNSKNRFLSIFGYLALRAPSEA